jgi:hypothetical protein
MFRLTEKMLSAFHIHTSFHQISVCVKPPLFATISHCVFIILVSYYMFWLYTGWRRETGKFEVDYEIPPRGQVPSAHAIRTWVRNFEETGSALKKKA